MGIQKSLSRSTEHIACPKCKKLGILVTENFSSAGWGQHRPRRIHELPRGFVAVDFSAEMDARIECAQCRIPASVRQ